MKTKIAVAVLGFTIVSSQAFAATSNQGILREGLLGAIVGAFSAEASGGKAGKGALIGAGTSVIGNALAALLFEPQQQTWGQPSYSQPVTYTQAAPAPQPVYRYQTVQVQQPVQIAQQPVYTYRQPDPVYVQQPSYSYSYVQPQQDYSKKVLRGGLLGAGVGAISAEASGGKAGTGALVGAGSNVIGGALLELLTG
jgi:hypothetical protein